MASYWQKYGLTCDPFVDDGLECEPFFPSRWHQQLDLLRHLSRSSNMVLLVTGISGVGKTTFMEMLFDKIESKAGVCKVHGSNGVTPDVLQELIIRHIGMPASGSPEANFQQRFVQQIDRMHQAKDEFYLVIDNAHKLPKSSLALLVDVAEWQTGEAHPLHLILFGGPQLDAMMAEITAQHMGEAMTHTIRIEPFSLEMTKEYILHRLTQASYEGSYPLSELQSNQIHQASNGIPAKINIIARQVLLDNDPKNSKRSKPAKLTTNKYREPETRTRTPKTSTTGSIATWLFAGAIAVVGIILFMVYYFRTPVEIPATTQQAQQTTSPVIADASAPTAVAEENSSAMQSDMDEDQTQTEGLNGMVASAQQPAVPKPATVTQQPDDESQTTSTQNATTIAANNETNTDTSQSQDDSSAATQTVPHSSQSSNGMWIPLNGKQAKTINQNMAPPPLNKPAVTASNDTASVTNNTSASTEATSTNNISKPTTVTKKTVVVAKPQSMPKTTTVKKTVVVNAKGLTNDEQALMAADASRFTLQIAAAADYQGLKAFINSAGLEGQVYFFRTLNQGNPWYVAVYGDYSDETAARAAITKLPASLLAREHPWPRSFGNIQKAIKVRI